jgi:VIT1/CCC1 family predicted Fe2+/Mn2+ transporter
VRRRKEQEMSQQVKVLSGINIVLGAWLIIAPFLLSSTDMVARWDSIVVGAVVLILAWIRAANPMNGPGLSWINAILGVWLIVAPWVLGFSNMTGSTWNAVIVGIGIAVFGAWSALATPTQAT